MQDTGTSQRRVCSHSTCISEVCRLARFVGARAPLFSSRWSLSFLWIVPPTGTYPRMISGARDEKTLPADPSLDDVSAEPQLRAHAYWMLGVIKFSEGRRPTKFPPEGGQSLLDTGSDHIFRGKKANLRQVSTRGGPNWLADFCSVLTAGLGREMLLSNL
ncbi:uncharacterized protein [Apostichopus japonicus]|uniref:uncharacterized protein isoform X2 n=1 Tax=Stichopus japonicus TaxID=307972 RepID=UPI003AB1FD08